MRLQEDRAGRRMTRMLATGDGFRLLERMLADQPAFPGELLGTLNEAELATVDRDFEVLSIGLQRLATVCEDAPGDMVGTAAIERRIGRITHLRIEIQTPYEEAQPTRQRNVHPWHRPPPRVADCRSAGQLPRALAAGALSVRSGCYRQSARLISLEQRPGRWAPHPDPSTAMSAARPLSNSERSYWMLHSLSGTGSI